METHSQLEKGAQQLSVPLSNPQLDLLLTYLELIKRWNKAYNLVGTSKTNELLQKHLLDSLSIVPYVKKAPVLDVGSGAGLPGIPLAISLPDISFTLLDSNGKKARFMRQAVMDLNLTNVDIVQTRVEDYQPNKAPNSVLSRAFAPLGKALEMLAAVCAPQGQVLIMLGVQPHNFPSLTQVNNIRAHSVTIPGLDSQRHILLADRA
ncbi:MAG: 16S rRNA (guanine(527)-N(7))-methyltransferase RsmG [Gammaproteobacteria bacterium]|nr:16S rRNA (guanine(527)-N(7))-methyltransferase RsmG [Gammaproteobacteria bacterium]